MLLVTNLSIVWVSANELTSFATLFTESAEALVIATVPTEITVIAESTPAMILVLIFFVFFIFLSPFSEFWFVLLFEGVENLCIIVMAVTPFLKILSRDFVFVLFVPLTVTIVYQVLYNRITTKNNSF